jgi:predicted TIM-barrel fold metal-dependent hydrolase
VNTRADCHIHLDKIGGPHETQPPSVESFLEYARREQISLFFAIYEQDETLARFRTTGFDFVPIYWERRPLEPSVPSSARAIKLHPYIENYSLVKENIEPTLEEARARGLFVFIHTEDRRPELSRGSLVARLAHDYPDLIFVMFHSGSYAPPKAGAPGSSWVEDALVHELVSEAVEVARRFDNVYLETSILASDLKAQILVKAPVSKLLIGTDFPILGGTHWSSLRFQENQLIRFGLHESDIERIHQNAMSFFKGKP